MNTKVIEVIKKPIVPDYGQFWRYRDDYLTYLRIEDKIGLKKFNDPVFKNNGSNLFFSLCLEKSDITYTNKAEEVELLKLNLDNKTILKKKFTVPKVGECWQWRDNVYMRISDELSKKLGDKWVNSFVSVCLNSPNGNSFTVTPKQGFTYHYKNLKFSNDTLEFNVI